MTTLHGLPVGAMAHIRSVREQALSVRMAAMGLRPGTEIVMVSHGASGSCLIRVGDARLSLARELARDIEVEMVHVQ